MTTNFKFKEDIAKVMATLENKAAGSADLSDVIIEIRDLVSEEYLLLIKQPDFNLSQFKAVWIQRIIAAKNNLNLTTEKKVVPEKIWKKVLPPQQQSPAPPSISRSSSSKSSPTTSESSNHRRITNRWNLKSGASVEDVVYNEAKLFSYEHPLHSFIIDLDDGSLRTIGGRYQERKTAGDHADLCFYYGSTELGCLEIGLADGGPHGTKELNEAGIKTPIMMKNFAIQISQQYGIKMNEIRIVGMVISGFNLTALLMTFKGSMSLITRSKRISLPQNVADIPRLLPLALKLVYNASQVVKGTMDTIKKASASVILDKNDDLPYFPPCHVSTNKRKIPEEEN